MWEKVAAWLRLLWEAGKQAEDNRDDIKLLSEDQRRLFHVVQVLVNDNQKLRDELRHERELRERDLENLKLELRLQILRNYAACLPPRKSNIPAGVFIG